jgi:maleate isomerase
MYGWRARIGLIYPSSGKRDYDYHRMAPQGVSVHFTRVAFSGRGTLRDIGSMSQPEHLVAAARLLADLHPACISWADTSGSFMFGPDGDRRQVKAISDAAGAPASTTSTSCVAACHALGLSKVAVASPYLPEVNDALRTFFDAHGISVVSLQGLGLEDEGEIHRTRPEQVYALGRAAFSQGAEGLFVPCTDFEAVDLIETLERDLRVPVITANQATMWHALRLSGINDHVTGFGKLVAHALPATRGIGDIGTASS